jgi:hypothetical protein
MFFKPNVGTHSGTTRDLYLPTSRFDCSIGTIWYHFSPSLNCLVLQCFVLHGGSGGGGGGSVVFRSTIVSSCLQGANDDNVYDWTDGIAARLHSQFARLSKALRRTVKLQHGYIFSGISLLGYRHRVGGSVNFHDASNRLLVEIAATCRSFSGSTETFELPAWSMLRETTIVVEQLENAFARAIFLGEALCKLSYSYKLCDYQPRTFRIFPINSTNDLEFDGDDARLYEESRAIISAIDSGYFDCGQNNFRHYVIASLLDCDVLSDVCRLRLMHSEMIYRLSMALARGHSAGRQNDEFRFARLAEFAHLSGEFFGIGDCDCIEPDIIDEFASHHLSKVPAVRQIVRVLSDYGESSMLIINKLPIDRDRNGNDTREPCERLCQLASEILCRDERTSSEP